MKVNLTIIGAQKAGTTSIQNYLRAHPQVIGHAQIEFSYFANDNEYTNTFETAYYKAFDHEKGLSADKRIVAKNVTICYTEKSLQRLKEHNPDCKILFLIREPVSRAYSSYTMAVKDGWMQQEFDDIIPMIESQSYDNIMYRHFIRFGHYADQLEMVLKYFPAKQIKIYLFEDLKTEANTICREIYQWLDIDEDFETALDKIHNPTTKPKSKLIASWINNLRKPNNPIKVFLKRLLPRKLFTNLSEKVIKTNQSDAKFDKISEEAKAILLKYYQPYNNHLKKLKDTALKDSFRILNRDNWLEK